MYSIVYFVYCHSSNLWNQTVEFEDKLKRLIPNTETSIEISSIDGDNISCSTSDLSVIEKLHDSLENNNIDQPQTTNTVDPLETKISQENRISLKIKQDSSINKTLYKTYFAI